MSRLLDVFAAPRVVTLGRGGLRGRGKSATMAVQRVLSTRKTSAKPLTLMTYAKGVLKTLMFTYPFALVALELPQMDISSFESCSRRACTFMQVFGKGLAPQEESCAKLGFVKAFHVIVNGRHSPTCDEDYFLEPICPSYSEKQMVDKCETLEVRESIINPLKSSWLQYGYAACIVGWAISSLLHDLLLMQDKNEFLTLRLGCVSALFQLLALMAGFFWSQDVLKVFASEVIPGV